MPSSCELRLFPRCNWLLRLEVEVSSRPELREVRPPSQPLIMLDVMLLCRGSERSRKAAMGGETGIERKPVLGWPE